MNVSVILRASELRKVLVQEGHTNLTPKWSLQTCAQMSAHEVDSPSLHPSTQALYTFLCPPTAGKGVPFGWGWPPPELEKQLERGLPVPVQLPQPQEWRLQVQLLWTSEGADGICWLWEHGGIFLVGVGWMTWGNVIWLPSGAHTDPPLILPLLIQSSAVPPSPTAALSPIVSWPVSTNLTPEKKKKMGSVTKTRLSHNTAKE